jgi:hypothetical protein
MKYIPVKGHPGLARSSSSGAIININSSEMSQEITDLKNDVAEMKFMLQKLIEEKHGSHSN